MKQQRGYPRVTVTPKAERGLTGGHPWVYDTEVADAQPAENGALVDVISAKGRYLGTGFISLHSKIRVRILSRNANDVFDEAFYLRRLSHAWEYRKTVLSGEVSSCRVIFGEADLFPGLTVDRFGRYLVAQTLSVGIERIKPMLFPLLVKLLRDDGRQIDGLYERNDVAIRAREGLEENKGWFDLSALGLPRPDTCLTDIVENGVRYTVDVENGQKTGFFLDQRFNRQAVARLAQGRTVLDCFTHTGSFALNAAKGGAAHVTAVDVSEAAVEMARRNADINGVSDRMDCVAANVFDLLPRLAEEGGKKYDFIILDPPAFTKSRKTVPGALRGYKEINYRAMKLLPRGGYLATCSCSHFATDVMFRAVLADAARDAGVQLRQIEARQQSPDHPILWGVDETNYLKFYLFQVF
ncbi:class I SAM-dependent rRNA methyltransferase [Ruthenibacterium lactatiformans]|uniref:Methyltransferase domain-containing protein n=1 Tax=Ruthenibacterium lactatiformans TaxID=1550024 RepID=A0A6I3Q5D4_9FIRM|nr:class I SAM-dependent rRNA methyltransferase [Ruthenibacterium lactatiformans]MTS14731.1 methyltransferase domain-containing protein [Ruthenibacterium lactatiformans]MTS18239.1 methyltransferase domain-containing protein [Ruthenibacterium lactatiformans]MTS34188.1 methyltransferase domain-containing protein [Ruthenibacterium lactatiformans]MTS47811.1 methyltransferase domain-containing protein [Ruthenibacterium lactatiformans]MTS50973.1 methyltransferase domain-containing protein [Rutheniba